MHATSPEQLRASSTDDLPPTEWVSDRLLAVALPIHEPKFVPYSLCYLLLDDAGGVHVLDPGWADEHNWRLLGDALADAGIGFDAVRSVVVTHLHPDHIGLAERLARRTGATVFIHRAELAGMAQFAKGVDQSRQLQEWGVPDGVLHSPDARALRGIPIGDPPPFDDAVHVRDGDRLPITGWDLRVVHTPGHTAGHICVTDAATGYTFTGDHVLPHIHPGIGLGGRTDTNPIADYLESLRKVSTLHGEVLPGHGYRFMGMEERCRLLGDRVLRRVDEVAAAMVGDATVWEIAQRMTWTGGFAALGGFRLESALEQVGLYSDYVRRER